jgi:hypothetical protein
MALDVVATLRTAYEDCVRQLQEGQALYKTHGDRAPLSIAGASVDWPAWEAHWLRKVREAQAAYQDALKLELAADQYTNGPVVVVTQGR